MVKEKRKTELIIWITIIILFLYGTYYGLKIKDEENTWYIVVLSGSIGLSLGSLIVLRKQLSERLYWIIKILALAQFFRASTVLCVSYIILVTADAQCELGKQVIWFQSIVIDFVTFCFLYRLIYYDKRKLNHTYIIMLVYMLVNLYCIVIPKALMYVIVMILIVIMVTLTVKMLRSRIWEDKHLINLSSIEAEYYCIIFLIQYILGLILINKTKNFYCIQYGISFIQTYIIFYCAYCNNVQVPWDEKCLAMQSASRALDSQNRYCEYIVNLSHELKTPVNVIKSALTILKMDYKQGNVLDEINILKDNCQHMMNIIQDMIDIQRIKSRTIKLNPKCYNIVELLDNVMDAFILEGYDGRIIFNPEEEEICDVVVLSLFQQAYLLLVSYLLRYQGKEPIYIEIDQKILGETKEIQVAIRADVLENTQTQIQIIRQSTEVNQAHIDDYLTLRLIWTIVRQHQGTIWFENNTESCTMYMRFQSKLSEQVEHIDEGNTQMLREIIRCRYQ